MFDDAVGFHEIRGGVRGMGIHGYNVPDCPERICFVVYGRAAQIARAWCPLKTCPFEIVFVLFVVLGGAGREGGGSTSDFNTQTMAALYMEQSTINNV